MKIHNFSAGPCILPQEVFEKTASAVLNLNNSGLSVMEISHRSQDGKDILSTSIKLVKELLNVPETHEVIFMQGGASLQFVCVAMNLLKQNGKAYYVETGSWANKAIKEAEIFGKVEVLASSKEKNYNYIPKGYEIPEDASYFHCTSNNTIFGTQMKAFPQTNIPLVCDMSSDILSKKIKVSDFGLIYAGAQKNMGPAGSTLVIVEKELLGKTQRKIPSYLDYQIHIDKKSAFNTWPVLSIYGMMQNLQWLKNIGGVEEIAKKNQIKAKLLYDEVDRNSLFQGTAAKEDRSEMNATFALINDSLQKEFDTRWNEVNIKNLKGHRSIGGYRASMYNAMPTESVKVLVEVMKQLENQFG